MSPAEQANHLIRHLLSATQQFAIPEGDDTIYTMDKGNLKLLTHGDPPKKYMIYRDEVTADAHLINPFAEGQSTSPGTLLFYRSLSQNVAIRVYEAIRTGAEVALQMKKKEESEASPTPSMIKLAAVFSTDVDDKMLEEIDKMVEGDMLTSMCEIIYLANAVSAHATVAALRPDWAPVGMRKKTIGLVQQALRVLFGVADTAEGTTVQSAVDAVKQKFKYSATKKEPPKLASWLNVYHDILFSLVDFLPQESAELMDFTYLRTVMADLPEIWQHTKFTRTAPTATATAQATRAQPVFGQPAAVQQGGNPPGVAYYTASGLPIPAAPGNQPAPTQFGRQAAAHSRNQNQRFSPFGQDDGYYRDSGATFGRGGRYASPFGSRNRTAF